MCGIAGYIGKSEISSATILSTGKLMEKRGPDNFSFKKIKSNNLNIYLLHSRLSIIDLNTRSNQPYTYKEKTLIFNGEIYNFIEIRNKLKEKGHKFRTKSDTEVLIKALSEYGQKAYDMFEGMWAIAIYDNKKNSIILSRDRFGEKPLCYKKTKNGIFFGSEIKFIEELSNTIEDINLKKSIHYMRYGYNSVFLNNETFKKNIFTLEPSYNLRINKKLKVTKKKYWSLKKFNDSESISLKDHIKDIRKMLINSVKIRLRSDVKNIFCLSGGVDSGGLVSISSKILKTKTNTYSIIDSKSKKYDESLLIQKTLKDTGAKKNFLYVENISFFKEIDKITKYFSSPVLTINYLLYSLMLREVSKKGYKVILSGNGADEIFGGYYDHYIYHLLDLKKNSQMFKINHLNWKKHVLSIIRNPKYRMIKKPKNNELISVNDNFSKFIKKEKNLKINSEKKSKSNLKNALMFQLQERLRPSLYQEDLNSMMYSVENRSPFLDRNLIEKVFSIPSKYFISNGYAKYLLRTSLKGILNSKVLFNRRKYGFNASMSSFKDINKKSVLKYIFLNQKKISKILYIDKIREYIKNLDFNNLSDEDNKFLFRLISLSSFIKTSNN